uniref:Uncharacterized protein n=1 Tax=Spongospora subterranea TaxID=70186 RepID=A0A0H5R4K2_9EUKA|eukprot:CRZ08757.1 hypothetical protein [Spongospora subterranea]
MTSWLLLPLLVLAFAPHVLSVVLHQPLVKYAPSDFYSNPVRNAELKGWQAEPIGIEPRPIKHFVMLKNIHIDWQCNIIISMKELSEELYQQVLLESRPYRNCPYSIIPQVATIGDVEIMFMPEDKDLHSLTQAVFNSQRIRTLAVRQQAKTFNMDGIYRPCPNSFQIAFQEYGTNGHRTLQNGDLTNCVPAEWPADFIFDQQRDQLLMVANQCGDLFSFYPGATFNIGGTAWLYDPDTRKVLTLTKMPPGRPAYISKPSSNLDILEDRIPLEFHPNYEELPQDMLSKLKNGFVDWSHTALRACIRQTGLYDEDVRQGAGADLIQAFLETKPKLMHLEDWISNTIAPSVNFNIVFKVKGISQLNTDALKFDREEGVVSAQFEDVSDEDHYAIENASDILFPSSLRANLSTRPVPPVDDFMPSN